MRPSEALSLHRDAVRNIVSQYHAKNARVFGSVLSEQDTEDSDLDLLIDPTAQTTLMDIAAIRYELKKLLGVEVDVLTPNAIPEKFKKDVLLRAIVV